MNSRSTGVDILIVGAGFAGAATAYHLRRRGAEDVLILEQESVPGVHSSGRNAAIVREYAGHPCLQPLVSAGAEELRRGRLAEFRRTGILLVGMGDEDVGRHFPRACGMGRWCPQDGTIDAAGLLQAYLTGQHVMYETRVLGWTRTVAGLCVHTNRGEMTCRLLVNAAGPWAGALGSIPLEPRNRHLFITTQLDWVGSDWPTVWDGRRGLYFRPESGGLLLCACDEAPAPPGDYSEDPHMLGVLHEKVETLQPGLGELSIRRSWVGQRTFAADQRFVIGFDPRNEHVFHVAGLGGHGVTASFGIGDLAADLILSGRNDPSDKFAPGRLIPPVPGGTGNSSSTPDEAASPGIAFA